MSIKLGKKQRVLPEIPTASMADIAFLLIVFFLVTTTMNQEKGLSLHLPPLGETKEVKQTTILNVWINAQDQIAFFENDNLTPVLLDALLTQVKGRLAANDKLIISLKAERGATYQMFVNALDELKLSGAQRISIAEPEE